MLEVGQLLKLVDDEKKKKNVAKVEAKLILRAEKVEEKKKKG